MQQWELMTRVFTQSNNGQCVRERNCCQYISPTCLITWKSWLFEDIDLTSCMIARKMKPRRQRNTQSAESELSSTSGALIELKTVRPGLSQLLLLHTERVREHQSHHVSGEPTLGVRPLRLPADPADLWPAGAGVEGLRCRTG